MSVAVRTTRLAAVLALALAGVFALQSTLAAPAKAAFEEGVVNVTGYNWSTSQPSVDVQLNDIAGSQNGQTTYTVREIVQAANSQTNQFAWATIPGIEITLPGSAKSVSCTGDQVRAQSSKCPTFQSTATATTMRTGPGQPYDYKNANPQIYIPQSKDILVQISPRRKKIKSGQSVSFAATVSNAIGKVTYNWNFGDGQSVNTANGKVSHRFTGSDKTFTVVVSVKASGSPRTDSDAAVVTIGKVKEKPPKKKETPKKSDDGGAPVDDGYYVPGYTDYGDGTGTGSGYPPASAPAAPSPTPDQPKEEEPQPPVDDGLETVSGQLVDPGTIATVVPPADGPATGTEQASPAEESSGGGGGLSEGAMTAIGIGALLGLGGLAEAGAFAGLRRFRFGP